MNRLQHASQETEGGEQYFQVAAVALLSVVYMFSPLVSYMGALLFLTIFSSRLSTRMRVAAGVIVILSGASIWASRLVGRSESDDFAWYYEIYNPIDTMPWTDKIPVYEVGLPLLIKIIRVALPGLTPNGLIFVLTTVTGLILLFCVERFGLRDFPTEKRAYCVAMVFLFFSFVLTTQLTRQMLSSVILVTVFFSLKPAANRLSLLLASVFHLSAVPVYAVVRMLQGRLLLLWFVLVSVVVLVRLVGTVGVASFVAGYGVPRVGYYFTSMDTGANQASFVIVLAVALAGLTSLLALKAANAQISSQEKRTVVVLVGVLVVYLSTLELTLAPFRLFLVIHAVLAGWFFAYLTRRLSSPWLAVGGAALIIVRAWSLYFLDPARAFLPWEVYGPFGAFPGYFVFSYLTS